MSSRHGLGRTAPLLHAREIVLIALGCLGFVAAFKLVGWFLPGSPVPAAPTGPHAVSAGPSPAPSGQPPTAAAPPENGSPSVPEHTAGPQGTQAPAASGKGSRSLEGLGPEAGGHTAESVREGAGPSGATGVSGTSGRSAPGAPGGPGSPGRSSPGAPSQTPEAIPEVGGSTSVPTAKEAPKDDDASGTEQQDPQHALELASLNFNPPEVAAGSTATLLITLTENVTGRTSVGGNVTSPSGAATLPFSTANDSGGSTYAVPIAVPARAEAGGWHVSTLTVLNEANYSLTRTFTAATVPPGGTLRVNSQEADSTPPVVRDITLERPTVHDNEGNRIRIEVDDEGSGVASVTGAFENHSKSALIWFNGVQNVATGLWEGNVIIPAQAECGDWALQQVRAVDKASNQLYLTADSPLVSRVGFALLRQEGCDYTPPSLETFQLSPQVVAKETGAEVQAIATVRDDASGTVRIFGWVAPASSGGEDTKINFTLSSSGDPEGPWIGRIPVPRFATKGPWKVGLVHVEDKAHNARDYRPNDPVIADATFTVE